MMNFRLALFGITLIAMSLLATPAMALKPLVIPVEGAYEVSMEEVSFPSTETGTLRVTTCSGCDTVSLRITGASQVFIGKAQVTMGEFRDFATNSEAPLYVFYKLGTDDVTRIVLSATQ